MVIYLDVLLALNLFIDFMLLSATSRILRLPPRRRRLVLGALAGSAASCLIFLPEMPLWLSLPVKILAAALIVRCAFRWQGVSLYIKQCVVFLVISALFSGVATALWFFAAPNGFYVVGGVVYYNVSPLMLTLLTVISYFLISLYDRVTHKRMASQQEYRLILDIAGQSVGLRTLYDTGHHATDVFSGSPVVIVGWNAVESYLPQELYGAVKDCLHPSAPPVSGASNADAAVATAVRAKLRMIPTHTVNGSSLLPAFRPERAQLVAQDGKSADITGVYVAVCRLLGRGEYQAIIGTDIVTLLGGNRSSCGQ